MITSTAWPDHQRTTSHRRPECGAASGHRERPEHVVSMSSRHRGRSGRGGALGKGLGNVLSPARAVILDADRVYREAVEDRSGQDGGEAEHV